VKGGVGGLVQPGFADLSDAAYAAQACGETVELGGRFLLGQFGGDEEWPVRARREALADTSPSLANRLSEDLVIRNLKPAPESRLRLLGDSRDLGWSQTGNDLRISLPPRPDQPAHVLVMEGRQSDAT
jgi:hypothetical protein